MQGKLSAPKHYILPARIALATFDIIICSLDDPKANSGCMMRTLICSFGSPEAIQVVRHVLARAG
jgi:hypothetical protein